MTSLTNSAILPLEKLSFPLIDSHTDNLVYKPALHPDLCQKTLSGILYKPIPASLEEGSAECIEYSELLDSIINDLQWLLMLNHAKFWCQVINDDSVHSCLNAYLKHAPRYKPSALPSEIQEKHYFVHRMVLMVFRRMSSAKESRECYMQTETFGQLIYDNFLFDVPRIMDICALYGHPNNQGLLQKMLKNIFKHQPQYNDDLQQAARTVIQILNQIDTKCTGRDADAGNALPAALSDGLPPSQLQTMSNEDFHDLVLYLSDIMHTIKAFCVDVYPAAAKFFFEVGLVSKLPAMYSTTVEEILSALRGKTSFSKLEHRQLLAHMKLASRSLISITYHIIKSCAFVPLLEAAETPDEESQAASGETFLQALTSLLSHRSFMKELLLNFDLRKDVETAVQANPHIEETQVRFVLEALDGISGNSVATSKPKTSSHKPDKRNSITAESLTASVAAPSTEEDIRMNSLISSVRDLLPDLGSRFIEACLKRFDLNQEKVIQVLLDDALPKDLQDMDRTAERTSSGGAGTNGTDAAPVQAFEEEPGPSHAWHDKDYVQERKNVYDNDEFDVFKHGVNPSSIDTSRMHRGKRDKTNDEKWRTGDEVERLRLLYSKYDIVDDEGSDEDHFSIPVKEASVYNDEYDDTYDDVIGANDADDADDLIRNRLKQNVVEESDEGSPQRQPGKNRQNFIENPEVIRARQEARRQQRQADFNKRTSRKKPPKQQNPPTEGSERDSRKKAHSIEHKRKEAHKASKSNHNRKKLATRKAAQGM